MRKWLSGLAVLAVGLPVMSQGPGEAKKTPESVPVRKNTPSADGKKESPSPELIEAQKKFAALQKEAEESQENHTKAQMQAMKEADWPEKRREYSTKWSDARGSYAVKAMELAKIYDPKDPSAFEPLFFAMQNGFAGRKSAIVDEAKDLLVKNQLDHQQFGKVIAFILSTASSIELRFSAMENIAKEAKSASTKGQAYFALGLTHQSVAAGLAAHDAKASEEHLKSAKEYFEIVIKDYPEVENPGGKVGVLARGRLGEMKLKVDGAAPEVTCLNIDGDKQDKLSNYKGKVVVLDFWTTSPRQNFAMNSLGKEQFEAMVSKQNIAAVAQKKDLFEKFKGKNFALISICGDEKRETLDKFLEKTKMPWILWFPGQKGVILDWGVSNFPITYIIDHKGVIRAKGLRGKALEKKVEELLAEVEK